MKRRFSTLDVFTNEPLKGNPLAVVLDAEGLDTERMQAIAREFNISETVFVLPPDNPAHNARIRIFTPGSELPFAGHPTVGTAILLALERVGEVTKEEDAIVVLEQKIGNVRIGVRLKPDAAPFAEFDAPVIAKSCGPPPDRDTLSMLLDLTNGEIGFENHLPSQFDAGVPFIFVPVRNLRVMGRIELDTAGWRKAMEDVPNQLFVYCRETVKAESAFHARMFAPSLGVIEDPATGAAAAAFAGVIRRFDEPVVGASHYLIEQGFEMGRPSTISLELVINGGLHAVRIGGHAVQVSEGFLSI